MFPWNTVRALIVGFALLLPLPYVLRQTKPLTWTKAVLLGSWLIAISIVFVGEVPSRLLYWFDASHATLAERFTFLGFMEGTMGGVAVPWYQVVADVVANTVQGIFFVIIAAGAYFWGERHRKAGRFKS